MGTITQGIDDLLKRGRRTKRIQVTMSMEEIRLLTRGAKLAKSKLASFIRAASIVGAAAYIQERERPREPSDVGSE